MAISLPLIFHTYIHTYIHELLNGRNKTIAHNTFAIPIITPTVGILDWTKKEIKDIDIMTRKIISMNRGSTWLVTSIDYIQVGRKEVEV